MYINFNDQQKKMNMKIRIQQIFTLIIEIFDFIVFENLYLLELV